MPAADAQHSRLSVFGSGLRAACMSVLAYVVFGTYVSIGALAHDFGFSAPWLLASTVLLWAGPAQVVLVTALGGGATLIETAITVGLTGVRLFPMVASMLPILKGPATRSWHLLLPTHLTAISMWVETFRLAPQLPREHRVAFCNGLGVGFIASALSGSWAGFYLAGRLAPVLTAALLFLTPLVFLVSTVRNSRLLLDRLALGLGLVIGPVLAINKIGLDLLWTGIIGGTLAYVIDRVRRAVR